MDYANKPTDTCSFENLPISLSIPNTHTMTYPKKGFSTYSLSTREDSTPSENGQTLLTAIKKNV